MNWGPGRYLLWRQLLKLNLFLLAVMLIARILFLCIFGQDILQQSIWTSDLIHSFILGSNEI